MQERVSGKDNNVYVRSYAELQRFPAGMTEGKSACVCVFLCVHMRELVCIATCRQLWPWVLAQFKDGRQMESS